MKIEFIEQLCRAGVTIPRQKWFSICELLKPSAGVADASDIGIKSAAIAPIRQRAKIVPLAEGVAHEKLVFRSRL
jgi:hypothetical protein